MTHTNTRKKMLFESVAHHSYFIPPALTSCLTEDDIITIYGHFITNGFYTITMQSLSASRHLLRSFLRATNYYHDVGCITLEDDSLDITDSITNIYYELLYGGYIDSSCEHNLEQFLSEQFYFDFIWIEATSQLRENSWFDTFQRKLMHLNIDQHIPIIVFSLP